MTLSHQSAQLPTFSLVIAVYNVAEYLSEFLASADALEVSPEELELIFVDDGGTDESVEIIQGWSERTSLPVTMFHQPNGGPGAARNLGLGAARGEWISFPDPDDVLAPDYLRIVHNYITSPRSSGAAMVSVRPIRFVDNIENPITPHALDFKYDEHERMVDLEQSPRFVHLHTNTSFYRADLIRRNQIRYDEEVRPVFEDAVFNIDYLRQAPRPTITFLRSGCYYYRKRADQGSLTGLALEDRDMFGRLLEKAYLAVLRRSGDPAPRWVQNTVFYDLQWMLKADARHATPMARLTPEEDARFHDLLDQLLAMLDEETLLEFHVVGVPVRIRLTLVARKNGGFLPLRAFVSKLDRDQRILLVSYFTSDPHQHEQVMLDGVPVTPTYAKTVGVRCFGRCYLFQRDLWIPAGRPVTLRVDGRSMPIVYGPVAGDLYHAFPGDVWRRYATGPPPVLEEDPPTVECIASPSGPNVVDAERADGRSRTPLRRVVKREWRVLLTKRSIRRCRQQLRIKAWQLKLKMGSDPMAELDPPRSMLAAIRRRAAAPAERRRFAQAWLLIDRDVSARDNAEAFYRHLQHQHPEINAWFVLSRHSPDWPRLAADGFRLIEFGSVDHMVATRRAKYVISSQADRYIVRPSPLLFGRPRWKFVFLQHGVIHNDLSRWLNNLPIRTMITTTVPEHRSIVADGTPYLLSEKEVALTGMPRHDALLARRHLEQRRILLIAPTWRSHLLLPQQFGHRRALAMDLQTSPFMVGWRRLLDHPGLLEAAEKHDLRLAFLAHPHLQDHVRAEHVPSHVEVYSMLKDDIQGLLAQTRLFITDYSSTAFDAAYLQIPVVYYQFDAEDFFCGRHTVRAGDYSYTDDGFGPVVDEPAQAVAAVGELLVPGSEVLKTYRRRMEAAFPFRDGRCSERVYEAIRQSEMPVADPLAVDPGSARESRDLRSGLPPVRRQAGVEAA